MLIGATVIMCFKQSIICYTDNCLFASQAQKCCSQRTRGVCVRPTERCYQRLLSLYKCSLAAAYLQKLTYALLNIFPTQKRRRKVKPIEKVETLRASLHVSPELFNGGILCNGVPQTSNPPPLTKKLLPPAFRDSPSEGSSEGSSHSDDPSFCGIATTCSRICDGVRPPKSQTEKRASRRRRSKPGCAVIDFLQAPKKDKHKLLQISTIEDIMNRTTERSSGTFGVNLALSGPV